MINVLEIDSLVLEIKSRVILNNVYLKSETGKITGLLGRNGTGKSFLMKILYGEIIPNDKSIRINKFPIFKQFPKDIRYLPQANFIPKHLTIKRVFKDFKLNFSDLIIHFPEFKKYSKSKIEKLSGGERRIIEIYLILVSKTKFCMLDEPFSQIMPLHIETIKKLILREKKNKGIIITDHMYQYITDISDDLYVVNNGKIHLTNSLKDLETLGYIRKIEK